MSNINKENSSEREFVIPDPEAMRNLEDIDNNEVKKTIKKENKKAFKSFIGVILIGGIAGGIGGFLISLLSDNGNLSPAEAVKDALFTITPFMLPLILLICGGITLYYYRHAKSLNASWDGEDEFTMNEAEIDISKAMIATSCGSIIGLFFMGVQIFSMMEGVKAEDAIITRMLIMFGYIVLMFVLVLCQKQLVDFIKVLNPEKKGSALDLKFQDIWMDSCDEAEKMNIYQSAYAAYKFMNVFLVVLWAVTMFIAIGFGTGLLAMTMISASWLALNLTYCIKSIKLERLK